VIADPHGNLYGTTYASVFEVRNNSVKVLHNFTGTPDGTDCQASLHRDAAGNLYGTTLFGGLFNAGTVFKIDTAGNETVLYSFTGGADGGHPSGSLIEDVAGNTVPLEMVVPMPKERFSSWIPTATKPFFTALLAVRTGSPPSRD